MSTYNLRIQLDAVSDSNEFLSSEIVKFDVSNIPIKNVKKLLRLAIKQAEELTEAKDAA